MLYLQGDTPFDRYAPETPPSSLFGVLVLVAVVIVLLAIVYAIERHR
jgi:hypothetical protein